MFLKVRIFVALSDLFLVIVNVILGSPCVGADLLMSMLANYCRNKGIKTSIRVGIVGIPNVGKSSIINSLIRGRACNVGCTPGVTRLVFFFISLL